MCRRTLHDDDGFTLVELMIASVLGVVVIALASAMLINGIRAQDNVTDTTAAASAGQLVSRSVEEGVRNAGGPPDAADDIQASGIKAEPYDPTVGQLLRARVAVGTSAGNVTWQCEAWYYSTTTGAVLWAHSSTGQIADPGGFHWADPSTQTRPVPNATPSGYTWTFLAKNLKLADGASAFFGAGGGRVILRFEVTNQHVSLVLIPNTVVQRKLATGGAGPAQCYDS